jgi:hypothetical protein
MPNKQTDELIELLDVLAGPPGWRANIEQLIQSREREAERRGADNVILELVTGWDGIARDIQAIHEAAKSLGRNTSALATRLSAFRPANNRKKGNVDR